MPFDPLCNNARKELTVNREELREGIVALTLGTSGVVFAATDRPALDPGGRVHTFCHAVEGFGGVCATSVPDASGADADARPIGSRCW